MQQKNNKDNKQKYEIVPLYSNNGKHIEKAIENAFLKYLKYNDYK